jgi:transcriptional regulator with XRE-family HTH domain
MAMNAEHAQVTGHRIVEAREALGWSQAELAERTGFTDNTIRKVERGERVRPGTLRRILDEVGVEPAAEVQSRVGFPADVQVVLDLVGMYLVALPEEERAAVAYSITRMLMERDGR